MKELVHLVAKHPVTKKIGTWETPVEQVSTACQQRWVTRPRRTYLPSLVDCAACKKVIADRKLAEGWAFAEVDQ